MKDHLAHYSVAINTVSSHLPSKNSHYSHVRTGENGGWGQVRTKSLQRENLRRDYYIVTFAGCVEEREGILPSRAREIGLTLCAVVRRPNRILANFLLFCAGAAAFESRPPPS